MSQERPSPAPITFELITRLAQETLLKQGYHIPTLIIDGTRNPIVIQIEELAPTFEGRTQQLFVTGQALAFEGTAGRLRGIYFVTEAWLSQAREGKLPHLPPSKDPQRKEVLVVNGLELNPRQIHLAIYEILRDRTGALREIRAWGQPDELDDAADTPLLEAFLAGFWGVAGLI